MQKSFYLGILSLVLACSALNDARAVSCDSLPNSYSITQRVRGNTSMAVMPSGGCAPGQFTIRTTAVSGSSIVRRNYCLSCVGGVVCTRPNATVSGLEGAIPGYSCAVSSAFVLEAGGNGVGGK